MSKIFYQANFCAECGNNLAPRRALVPRYFCDDCSTLMRRRTVITPLGYLCAGMLVLWMLTGNKSDKRENKTIKSVNVAAATSSPTSTPVTIDFQEHHYTCGARTKKGTPCKRRVKAVDLRCMQHQGRKRIKN